MLFLITLFCTIDVFFRDYSLSLLFLLNLHIVDTTKALSKSILTQDKMLRLLSYPVPQPMQILCIQFVTYV